MLLYISSEKHNHFVNQRVNAIKESQGNNNSSYKNKIFLFTDDIPSLKRLNSNLKKKPSLEINIVDQVINEDNYYKFLTKPEIYFQFYFFIRIIKFYYLQIFYLKNYNIFFHKVKLIFIFITNDKIKLKLTNQSNIILLLSKPYFDVNVKQAGSFGEIDPKKKQILYFDSAFPLHPDIIGLKTKIIFDDFLKNLLTKYLDYVDRKFEKKKIILFFMHPRTFNIIKKNNKYKKFILDYKPKRFIFFNGLDSYLKMNNNKSNQIVFSQPGGQLHYFKQRTVLIKNKLKIVLLDNKLQNFLYQKKNNYKKEIHKNIIHNLFETCNFCKKDWKVIKNKS